MDIVHFLKGEKVIYDNKEVVIVNRQQKVD